MDDEEEFRSIVMKAINSLIAAVEDLEQRLDDIEQRLK